MFQIRGSPCALLNAWRPIPASCHTGSSPRRGACRRMHSCISPTPSGNRLLYLCNQQNQFSAIQIDKLFQNHYLQGSRRQRHSVKTNKTFHHLLTVFKAVIHDFIQGAPVLSLGRFHSKGLLDASFALPADSPCPIRALAGWSPEHCWTHHGHHTHQLV